MVRGYAETRTRRLALQGAVEPFWPTVNVSVHAMDEVIEQARRCIGNSGIAAGWPCRNSRLRRPSVRPPPRRRPKGCPERTAFVQTGLLALAAVSLAALRC